MRIGFSSIYSWRPHVEHLEFLARLARQAGHETFYLTCDSDLPTCYSKELRPDRSPWMHCARCRIGGVRSYAKSNVSSIGEWQSEEIVEQSVDARSWVSSSASTLGRFESDVDFGSDEFRRLVDQLEPVGKIAYGAAKRWIEQERLDAVCLFNGRMDAMRGILEAARACRVRCITLERTWFGDGLQLNPDENCLGLREVSRLVSDWRSKPLTRAQAYRAAGHVASRFLRRNSKEWRAYNAQATVTPWPVPGSIRKVLLVPGSRNEVWGHPDWASSWSERTAAFDAVMSRLGLRPKDVVLRCHPNWGEKIGNRTGRASEDYYTGWAQARGIFTIPSIESISTLGLIEQADAVVVCGGSAALDAAIIGKQVIAVTPSVYQDAGFQSNACTPQQLATLNFLVDQPPELRTQEEDRISRLALRFCYTMVFRVAQYVDFVKCQITTDYRYLDGADPNRLIDLIKSGVLQPDDTSFDSSEAGEAEILRLIRDRAWGDLIAGLNSGEIGPLQPIKRRWKFRAVDRIRATMPRGDL